jgi:hypothetical protein
MITYDPFKYNLTTIITKPKEQPKTIATGAKNRRKTKLK